MNKTLLLLFFAILLISRTLFSQNINQEWKWAKSYSGSISNRSESVALDNDGNTIIGGNFDDPVFNVGSYTLNRVYNSDAFLVKHDSEGNVIWAKSFGGTGADYLKGINTDTLGNIYISGSFDGANINIGGIILTNTSTSYSDIYIAKLNSSGEIQWAKSMGTNGSDYSYDITVDRNGNSIITGGECNSCVSGSSTYWHPYFIAKYSTNGVLLWKKTADSQPGANDIGYGIAVDYDCNIYVVGSTNGIAGQFMNFGTITVNNPDFFLVKYDSNGNEIWAKGIAGIYGSHSVNIATDKDGGVYVAGNSQKSPMIFDSIALTFTENQDIFLVKYDQLGNVLWAKHDLPGSIGHIHCVTTDHQNNILIVGHNGYLDFGTFQLSTSNVIFIAKFKSDGVITDLIGVEGSGVDFANDVVCDGSKFYLTGNFESQNLSFGNQILYNSNNNPSSNCFLAKYNFINYNQFIVYPNPNSGSFTIANKNSIDEIQIFNSYAQLEYSVNPNKTEHNLNFEKKGVFYVRIKSKDITETKKIIIY